MQYCNKYTVKCNIIQSSIQKPDNLFQLSASEKINVLKNRTVRSTYKVHFFKVCIQYSTPQQWTTDEEFLK